MKKNIIVILVLVLGFASTSCLKRFKKGCTYEEATNYDEKVGQDDGTCTYESKTSFWFNESQSYSLINYNDVTMLSVYVDEKLVGTIDPADWKVGPDCNGANFTVNTNWTGINSLNVGYLINDQNGTKRYEGGVFLTGNSCNNVELN